MSVRMSSPGCFLCSTSLFLTGVGVLLANPAVAGPLEVTAVRCSPLADSTEIAIEITGETRYRLGHAENPSRIFFDFIGTRPYIRGRRLYSVHVDDKLVNRIRVAETAPEVTRVVLDLESAVEFKISRLYNPSRFVIELSPAGTARAIGRPLGVPPERLQTSRPEPRSMPAPPRPVVMPSPTVSNPPTLNTDVPSTNLARPTVQPPSASTPITAPIPPPPFTASNSEGNKPLPSAQTGVVKSANQPIPGATVTATQGTSTVVTTTDTNGHFSLPPLGKGASVEVAMVGFERAKKELTALDAAQELDFTLQLKEATMTDHPGGSPGASASDQNGNQVESQPQKESDNTEAQQNSPAVNGEDSDDAFLVSGTLSKGQSPKAAQDSSLLEPGFGDQGGQGAGFGTPNLNLNVPGFGGGRSSGRSGGHGGGRRGDPGRNGDPRQFGNRHQSNQVHGTLSVKVDNSGLNAPGRMSRSPPTPNRGSPPLWAGPL